MKKYPFYYEDKKNLYTQKEAIIKMAKFIVVCRENDVREKAFYLYLEDEYWKIYAESMKDNAKGELIKKFNI